MVEAVLARVSRALHPLAGPPPGTCWNAAELEGLFDPASLRDAAVLVGLVPRGEGIDVLLTRRHDGLRTHAGQVSFPGGRVDDDDSDVVDAALRETLEEVGIARGFVEPLGLLDPLATITGFRVWPVVARIDPQADIRPDPREVAEVFEVPLAYLLDPANLSARRFVHGDRLRTIWEYRYPTHRIWGATASILLNLHARLEASA